MTRGKVGFLAFLGCFAVLVVLLLWLALRPDPPVPKVDFDNYTPSAEFKEAYNALHRAPAPEKSAETAAEPKPETSVEVVRPPAEKPAPEVSVPAEKPAPAAEPEKVAEPGRAVRPPKPLPDGPGKDFDAENTFMVMRAMELAQQRCGDWMEFLRQLASMDYSGVPSEVLEAQAKLLPIMERLHEVEDELDENSGSMAVLNALGSGAMGALGSVDGAGLLVLAAGGPLAGLKAKAVLETGVNKALDSYKASGSKRKAIARELKEVQRAYVQYLAGYMPIRRKYEMEWDSLCLMKDKAYLQFGKGDYENAAESAKAVYEKYPYDRESVILRALSLARLAMMDAARSADAGAAGAEPAADGVMSDIKPSSSSSVRVSENDPRIVEAKALLDRHVAKNPALAAPALVVKGVIECAVGDVKSAMTSLDQSSLEYPRQAERLADMFEAYASRPYLEKTAEGQRLLRLHRSLCEGFGAFSPNLEKAFVYERSHDYAKAKEEIFNHFFRRSNQESIHELFSDMEFCESNLSVGFKSLVPERTFFDVEYSQVRDKKWLGMTTKDGVIEVALQNRADIELTNVRLFLCVHFTEMYTGEYDVLRVGAVGKLAPGEKCVFDPVSLGRDGKTFRDIAGVRAIVMTDDRICWVDSVKGRRSHAANVMFGHDKVALPFTIVEYLAAFGTDVAKLARLAGEAPIVYKNGIWPKSDTIEVSLPRIFAILDPVFTIGEIGTDDCVYPDENRVAGSRITLRFPVNLKDGATCDLCVYSDYVSFRIRLKRDGKSVSIADVSRIKRGISGGIDGKSGSDQDGNKQD